MFYPVFLDLRGKSVLLVGGGSVARAKLSGLVAAGAHVTVVAPEIDSALAQPGVRLVHRPFQPADLDGVWFAVSAAPGEVNGEVARAAEERRIFVNAADDVSSASAYLGGVVRKQGVTIAVSTQGRAPALAGLLREALEAILPDDVAEWVRIAENARVRWKEERVPIAERRPLLLRALDRLYEEHT